MRTWIRQRVRLLLLAVVAGHIAAALVAAQSQETINATQNLRLDDVSRRVERFEAADVLARVALLESSVAEIKWLTRSAAVAVVGQLVLSIMERRRAKAGRE